MAVRYPAALMRSLLAGILALIVVATLAACGGGDNGGDTSSTPETTASTGPCTEIEEVDVPAFGNHENRDFTAADYPTNPPAGGDHNPTPLDAGQFYTDPPRLGEAVHLLEHGAVIGWTNDLSAADQKAVEDEFNDVFQDGYYQLAVVENPELDVPFALSAWGALQKCDEVDTSVIRPFVEEWYASPKSGESNSFACNGEARQLPPC
jgi:hypothetical protein